MKNLKKHIFAAVAAGMMISALSINSLAATRKSIPNITLSIESNIIPGEIVDVDAVEISTKSERFHIGEVEFTNPIFSWEITDVPEMKITLYASEDYYFTLGSSKDVKLSGGATYVKATKQDNWETLVLTVKLTPLAETIGEIEEAKWSSIGMATWNPVIGAGGYEVKLFRDGSGVGTAKVTSDISYDFSSIMTKPAGYSFRVRAVNASKTDIKSAYMESNMIVIDSAQAALFRAGATAQGWKQDATGWWYQNADNSFTKDNWQTINDKWYFFNAQGYMVTGWITWQDKMYYCAEGGEMLVNTETPDKFYVDADGVRVN